MLRRGIRTALDRRFAARNQAHAQQDERSKACVRRRHQVAVHQKRQQRLAKPDVLKIRARPGQVVHTPHLLASVVRDAPRESGAPSPTQTDRQTDTDTDTPPPVWRRTCPTLNTQLVAPLTLALARSTRTQHGCAVWTHHQRGLHVEVDVDLWLYE